MTVTAAHRGKIVSEAEFRRMWFNSALSVEEIGNILGISQAGVSTRAKTRKLPNRTENGFGHFTRSIDDAVFADMWAAGVGRDEIATHYGCSLKTVRNTRARLGLEIRGYGERPKMTMAQFLEARLSARMAETAKIERAALWDAEMIDGHRNRDRMAA